MPNAAPDKSVSQALSQIYRQTILGYFQVSKRPIWNRKLAFTGKSKKSPFCPSARLGVMIKQAIRSTAFCKKSAKKRKRQTKSATCAFLHSAFRLINCLFFEL
ncbi:hypothetical protein [Ligilactobacillus ruminis]|uniref:hypothetical protein n=1 Tax=Ligilactobacillus ruminis TaxID=1623 RepID=UPI0022DFA216|nr:hypothetical protein [Ligilactobacillus ruminis]